MPRDGEVVRRRLRQAALELFEARGYERTTSAEIAARAGVTERTFFRQFPDKREALFDGEGELAKVLVAAIQQAPSALGIWDVLLAAFQATVPFLVENQPFARTAPPYHRQQHGVAGAGARQDTVLDAAAGGGSARTRYERPGRISSGSAWHGGVRACFRAVARRGR